ncbi:MAG: hypothetical protein KDA60_13385 [Planctomycetales bacterium]|nr:hypothetical protein [Planctomycetales bacterium]
MTGIIWSTEQIIFPTFRVDADADEDDLEKYSGGALLCLPIELARGLSLTNEVTGKSATVPRSHAQTVSV